MPPKSDLFRPALLGLLALKTLLHGWAVSTGYGLHRDEFLYLAEGAHPGWGYMEGPPVIGWVATLSTAVLGSSVWAAKLPVLLVGLLSIYILLSCVREFGGGKMAQLLAGLAWVLSPVYLGSNALFQPVSFNQLAWLLLGWSWIRLVKYRRRQDYLQMGLFVGLALLTKYSAAFYLLALLVGVLLTPQRKILFHRHALAAFGIALLLFLPNLIWQITHNLPVVGHMRELAATQLVNVSTQDFLLPQFIFHAGGIWFWLAGLLFLLGLVRTKASSLTDFRSLGLAYLGVIVLLLLLSGKSYYSYGAYSILYAAGAVFWVQKLGDRSWWVALPLVFNFFLIPFALPVLPVPQMKAYGDFASGKFNFNAPLRWEDGSYRRLSQDFADMHGWEEMAGKVARFYHGLTPQERADCTIEAGNYGQAGALTFYRNKYDLPRVHSFNASFLLWEDGQLDFKHQIVIDDSPNPTSPYFRENRLIDSTGTKFAREQHYIYFRSEPTEDLAPVWKSVVAQRWCEELGKLPEGMEGECEEASGQ